MNSTAARIVRSIAITGAAGIAILSGASTANAMDSASGHATDSHRTAVVQLAADGNRNPGTGTSSIEDGLNSNQPQQVPGPYTPQAPAYNPQQIQTQAGGGAISVTVAIGVGLFIAVILMVKNRKVAFLQAFICIALGIYLAPTFFGPLVQQLGGAAASSFGNIWTGL